MATYNLSNNNLLNNKNPKDQTTMYIIIAVVVLLLGGVGYWYYTKEDEEDDVTIVTSTPTPAPAPTATAAAQAATAAAQTATAAQTQAEVLLAELPAPEAENTSSAEDTMAPLDTSVAGMGRRITDIYSLPRGENNVELTTPCRAGYEVVTRDAGRYKNLTFCAKFEDGPGKGLSKIGVSRGECNHNEQDGAQAGAPPPWNDVRDGFEGDEAILLNRPNGHHNVLCWEESESAAMNPVFQKDPKTCATGTTMISYRRDGKNLPTNTGSFMNESNGHDYYVCGDLA